MDAQQQVEQLECPFCHQTYRYDENRHCWSCDATVCPHCLPDGPEPLCPECSQPVPANVEPMLAVSSSLPGDPVNWGFEYKWDGVRAICRFDGHSLRIFSRNGKPITGRYPELSQLGDCLPGPIVLDGEIVALDEKGRPSFPLLQKRMHRRRDLAAAAARVPIQFYLFDVLYESGRDLTDLPYRDRREILESAELDHPHLRVPPSHTGKGSDMLSAARKVGLEGVMAKRLDSPYQPGQRTGLWRKIKIVHGQEFVIGGWVAQQKDARRIGSLKVGYYDGGRLQLAGSVGTGFAAADHKQLRRLLEKFATDDCPFVADPGGDVQYVQPRLVAQVEFRRWPRGKQIQQAAYKGLRDDVEPGRVVRESIAGE